MRAVDVKASEQDLTLARALAECLADMERGETDLDALAARYPEAVREVVRPLLEIAARLWARRRAEEIPLELLRRLHERFGREAAAR